MNGISDSFKNLSQKNNSLVKQIVTSSLALLGAFVREVFIE